MKIEIEGLRKTHYQHLKDVLNHITEEGVYWGRKDYFDKRTMDLNIVLDNIIQVFEENEQ